MKIDESRDDLDDQSTHHCVYGTQTSGLLFSWETSSRVEVAKEGSDDKQIMFMGR